MAIGLSRGSDLDSEIGVDSKSGAYFVAWHRDDQGIIESISGRLYSADSAKQGSIQIFEYTNGYVPFLLFQENPVRLVFNPVDRRYLVVWGVTYDPYGQNRHLIRAQLVTDEGNKVGEVLNLVQTQGDENVTLESVSHDVLRNQYLLLYRVQTKTSLGAVLKRLDDQLRPVGKEVHIPGGDYMVDGEVTQDPFLHRYFVSWIGTHEPQRTLAVWFRIYNADMHAVSTRKMAVSDIVNGGIARLFNEKTRQYVVFWENGIHLSYQLVGQGGSLVGPPRELPGDSSSPKTIVGIAQNSKTGEILVSYNNSFLGRMSPDYQWLDEAVLWQCQQQRRSFPQSVAYNPARDEFFLTYGFLRDNAVRFWDLHGLTIRGMALGNCTP